MPFNTYSGGPGGPGVIIGPPPGFGGPIPAAVSYGGPTIGGGPPFMGGPTIGGGPVPADVIGGGPTIGGGITYGGN